MTFDSLLKIQPKEVIKKNVNKDRSKYKDIQQSKIYNSFQTMVTITMEGWLRKLQPIHEYHTVL